MYTADELDEKLGTNKQLERNSQWRDDLRRETAKTTETHNALKAIRDRENFDKLNESRRRQDAIEEAISATDPNTGKLSEGQLRYLNSKRGIDDSTGELQDGQILFGGYLGDKSGDYVFNVASKRPDGSIGYEPHRFSRAQLYGMMSNRPDLFDQSQVEEAGRALQAADSSYVPEGRLAGLVAKDKAARDKRDRDIRDAQDLMTYGVRGRGAGNRDSSSSGSSKAGSGSDYKLNDQRLRLLENKQKMRDSIATSNPDDPRLKSLDRDINRLNALLGMNAGITGVDELASMFGVTDNEPVIREDIGEKVVDGEVTQDPWFWESGDTSKKTVKRVVDETDLDANGRPIKTGNKIVNFEDKQKNGKRSVVLGNGKRYKNEDEGLMYENRNGTIVSRPISKADDDSVNVLDDGRAIVRFGKESVMIPNGATFKYNGTIMKNDNGKFVEDDSGVAPSWSVGQARKAMSMYNQQQSVDAQRTAAENAKKDRENKARERQRQADVVTGYMKSMTRSSLPDAKTIKDATVDWRNGAHGRIGSGTGGWDDLAVDQFKKGVANTSVKQSLKDLKTGMSGTGDALKSAVETLHLNPDSSDPIDQAIIKAVESGEITIADFVQNLKKNLAEMNASKRTAKDKDRDRFYDNRAGK